MTDDIDVVDSEVEYENPYFGVVRDTVAFESGYENDYYRVDFGDGGVITLGTHDGDVLFVELYRPRLDGEFLELPGGGIDEGETPEEAARREFEEETGFAPSSSQYLGSTYFSAWTRTERHFVWVNDLERVAESERGHEVVRVPTSEALDETLTGPVADWNVTALTMARQEGLMDDQ